MSIKDDALVSIVVYSMRDEELLRSVLELLASEFDILSLSSVYRVQKEFNYSKEIHGIKNRESFGGMVLVARVHGGDDSESLFFTLRAIEKKLQTQVLQKKVSLNLLAHGSVTLMSPFLTLPHPDFHLRPEFLEPAREVWPDFIHPVLGNSLSELSEGKPLGNWGEYYAQGQNFVSLNKGPVPD